MTVIACIYSVDRNLSHIEVGAQNGISENDNIIYATTIFSEIGDSCQFLILQGNQVPEWRSEFFVCCEHNFYHFSVRGWVGPD